MTDKLEHKNKLIILICIKWLQPIRPMSVDVNLLESAAIVVRENRQENVMAGHSKWANIKHKKAANDKKRGKLWTKLIREITVAAKEGQTSDPAAHPRLRLAVDKGLAANMPKDTIDKA